MTHTFHPPSMHSSSASVPDALPQHTAVLWHVVTVGVRGFNCGVGVMWRGAVCPVQAFMHCSYRALPLVSAQQLEAMQQQTAVAPNTNTHTHTHARTHTRQ